MRKFFVGVALAAGCISGVHAQGSAGQSDPERGAVIATVQKLFDAMLSRDVEAAKRLAIPEAWLTAVREENGQPVSRSQSIHDFAENLGKGQGRLIERMWDPEVRVRGRIATLWAPDDFHRDTTFSHCGIDAIDLVRTADGWKIAGGVYTVEREGCPPSPLGPVK